MKIALIAGSTGLVGSHLLSLLLASDRYTKVKALIRTASGLNHPKLIRIIADYSKLESYKEQLTADDIFCCVGTTMARARTKEKFREADYIFPLALAKLGNQFEAKQFLIVSALGANKGSSFFYNRVKGEMEEEVRQFDFQAIHIFRPSLLLGERTESRPAEDAAKLVYKVFGFLLSPQYKAIPAAKVAQAMLDFASREQKGVFMHESRELQKI
jgi:uncharacterized protein YbjT (DUF2867 family)